jgi:hypothetical protein
MIFPAAFRRDTVPAPDAGSAFISIAPGWRRALLAYYLVYQVATPVLQEIALPSSTPLAGMRLGMDILLQTLTFLPIFFYRPSYGWLHPLVFPTLYALANDIVRTPAELLRPLAIGLVPRESTLQIDLLSWYSDEVVARGELKLLAIRVLALLAYYAGYFVLARGRAAAPMQGIANQPRARRVRAVAVGVAASALLGLLLYLVQRGGIQAHVVEYWGGGRGESESTGGVNVAQQALDFAVVALLLWYALEPGIPRNPFFSGAVGVALALEFLISGSRSNLFYTVVLFVVVWMLRHRRVPTGRVVVLGMMVMVLLGPMGDFRRSVTKTGQVDWGMLTDVRGAFARTNDEIAFRASRGGGVPVMIRVPGEVGFLHGKSYVGGVLFFVPRMVWESKPHGVGYYNSTIIFGRGGFGLPIPGVAEAYWNFYVPGVIVIFLLFGVFHRYAAAVFTRNGHHPTLWVPYVLALFYVVPSSNLLTTGARVLGASLAMLVAMGAWKPGSRPRPAPRAAPGFRVRPADPVPQPDATSRLPRAGAVP